MNTSSISQENPGLNDGLLEYGKIVTKRDQATAKRTGEGFEKIGSLYFSLQSINARFDRFQVSSLSTIDLKIRCYYVNDFDKAHKIKIEDSLYELESFDVDSKKEFMYLFLKKVGEWHGKDFVKKH